ncbi:MAG: DUF1015 domain-containing protein [Chloroflexi bacterium HGW-Chloroflexi-3]|nr:MAG: DUF1015 domain-containing protein [Chloroflexi bacterium HGW-Chloroflexi-3]
MEINNNLGFQIPKILLPVDYIDFQKWAVIACDQYTSQPEYWTDVEDIVGSSPSTLNMILPEVYLETEEEFKKIELTKKKMDEYLEQGVFRSFEGLILVERHVGDKTRFGLMLALDLEKYDFQKGSQTLIRATEGTIIDRLPPRIRIREGAKLEFPHILVLIDDPEKTVIEPLVEKRHQLDKLYDFELMKNSGHLIGYGINQSDYLGSVENALGNLANSDRFMKHYNVGDEFGVLLFAMGDGNHSLATAKSIWESVKSNVGMDHPSRYALVEIENIHDAGLDFEPIHRVLFNLKDNILEKMRDFWKSEFNLKECKDQQEMIEAVDHQSGDFHKFGFIYDTSFFVVNILPTSSNLPVGTLQTFLDEFLQSGGAEKIDYVHGSEVTCSLGTKPGNCSFYLPAMEKNQLFKTVILDGALPRKTFSMGEAYEKRFYMEGRRITK